MKARRTERIESKEEKEWVVLESPRRESGAGKVEREHVDEEKGKVGREGEDEKEERPVSREDQRVSTPDIQLVTRYAMDNMDKQCVHAYYSIVLFVPYITTASNQNIYCIHIFKM